MIVGVTARAPARLESRGVGETVAIDSPYFHSLAAPASTRIVDRLRWFPLASMAALGGCSARSAPALILFGAYFPDWLVFAVLATLIAIATHILFGIAGKADALPYALFTCLAVGILVAGVIDLLWLGR